MFLGAFYGLSTLLAAPFIDRPIGGCLKRHPEFKLNTVHPSYKYNFNNGVNDEHFWRYNSEENSTERAEAVPSPWGKALYLTNTQHVTVKDSHEMRDVDQCPWSVLTCSHNNTGMTVSLLLNVPESLDKTITVLHSNQGVTMQIHKGMMRVYVDKLNSWRWSLLAEKDVVYNVWTHWVVTWSQENGAKLYRDSKLVDVDSKGFAEKGSKKEKTVFIGLHEFEGLIDELEYHAAELPSKRVIQIYEHFFPEEDKPLSMETTYKYDFNDGVDNYAFWKYNTDRNSTVKAGVIPSPWGRAVNISKTQFITIKDSHHIRDIDICPWSIKNCAYNHRGMSVSLLTKITRRDDANETTVNIVRSNQGVIMQINKEKLYVYVDNMNEWQWFMMVEEPVDYDLWTHLVVTWSEHAGAKLYKNGTLVQSDPVGIKRNGRRRFDTVFVGNGGFVGQIDEISYYAQDFTAKHVSQLFHHYFPVDVSIPEPMYCEDPIIPPNTELINKADQYEVGYRAVFSCHAGIEPIIAENNILTCNELGEWEGTMFVCSDLSELNRPGHLYLPYKMDGLIHCPTEEANPHFILIVWMKNERVIDITHNSKYELNKKGTLVIHDVDENDEGRYTCTPYSPQGVGRSSPVVQVLVRNRGIHCKGPYKPKHSVFSTEIGDEFYEPGYQARFQCQEGTEPLDVAKTILTCNQGKWDGTVCLVSSSYKYNFDDGVNNNHFWKYNTGVNKSVKAEAVPSPWGRAVDIKSTQYITIKDSHHSRDIDLCPFSVSNCFDNNRGMSVSILAKIAEPGDSMVRLLSSEQGVTMQVYEGKMKVFIYRQWSLTQHTPVVFNKWTHWVVTWSENNGAKLYMNGSLVDHDSAGICTSGTRRPDTVFVGDRGFTGQIDELGFYADEFSAAQVSGLHENYFPIHRTDTAAPVTCQPPPVPKNARLLNEASQYEIGEKAEFGCKNKKFLPLYPKNTALKCNESGKWNGEDILCKLASYVRRRKRVDNKVKNRRSTK